mgnify:CR=1 FL=1
MAHSKTTQNQPTKKNVIIKSPKKGKKKAKAQPATPDKKDLEMIGEEEEESEEEPEEPIFVETSGAGAAYWDLPGRPGPSHINLSLSPLDNKTQQQQQTTVQLAVSLQLQQRRSASNGQVRFGGTQLGSTVPSTLGLADLGLQQSGSY